MTQHSAKSTVDSVRMPFLQSMIFTVPPIPEQQQITDLLDKESILQQQLLEKLEQSIEKLKEFRCSLITACVTGQLDIQEWQQRGMTDRRLDKIEEDMESSKRASA